VPFFSFGSPCYIACKYNTTQVPIDQLSCDAFSKIRLILDYLSLQFQNSYTPKENMTIDEAVFTMTNISLWYSFCPPGHKIMLLR
jgi:hypothetical protein